MTDTHKKERRRKEENRVGYMVGKRKIRWSLFNKVLFQQRMILTKRLIDFYVPMICSELIPHRQMIKNMIDQHSTIIYKSHFEPKSRRPKAKDRSSHNTDTIPRKSLFSSHLRTEDGVEPKPSIINWIRIDSTRDSFSTHPWIRPGYSQKQIDRRT